MIFGIFLAHSGDKQDMARLICNYRFVNRSGYFNVQLHIIKLTVTAKRHPQISAPNLHHYEMGLNLKTTFGSRSFLECKMSLYQISPKSVEIFTHENVTDRLKTKQIGMVAFASKIH